MLDFIQDTIEKIIKFIHKTKKIYLGIGAAVAVLLIVLIAVMIKQTVDRQKGQLAQEQLEQAELQKEMDALKLSDQPLSPEEIIEREKGIIGGEIPEDLGIGEKKESPEKQKAPRVTKDDLKLMSEAGLLRYLPEVLPKGKPGPIVQVLKEMKKRNLDVVRILRKIIIDSPDDIALRKNAILGLYYIGGKEVIPLLKASAQTDHDETVRKLALFCVDFLAGGGEADFFAEIAQADPSQEIRAKAQEYFDIRNTGQ